jgi:lipoate-protein ligase A
MHAIHPAPFEARVQLTDSPPTIVRSIGVQSNRGTRDEEPSSPRSRQPHTRPESPKAGPDPREARGYLVATLRSEYGDDFPKGYRSDAQLGTVREDTGKNLHQLIKKCKD